MDKRQYISAREYAALKGISKSRVLLLIRNKRRDRIPERIKVIDSRPFMLVTTEEAEKARRILNQPSVGKESKLNKSVDEFVKDVRNHFLKEVEKEDKLFNPSPNKQI